VISLKRKDKTCSFGWRKAQVIVATNALEWEDKADVKTVIHISSRKLRKLLSRSRSIWRNGEKHLLFLTNPSDISKQKISLYISSLTKKF
jgi:hypothetical protein